MKASYNWLKSLVHFHLTPDELADKLTLIGLEVEKVTPIHDDFCIEFEITPNRSDCLSHIGIAREIAAHLGKTVTYPPVKFQESETPITEVTSVQIDYPEGCPRYCARVIRNVKIEPSPEWLQRTLETCGIRPINNIVDATNYVLLEMGQPLHAFDLDQLDEHRIIVRQATSNETFITLDGVERKLAPDSVVIADGSRAVALGGVMGGLNSEVTPETQNILLESAYFTPRLIRLGSKFVKLHTEASHRFERGVDPNGVPLALDRVAQLILSLAGGELLHGQIDAGQTEWQNPTVTVRPSRVNHLLGTNLDARTMVSLLETIEFETYITDTAVITVQAPTFRTDMDREVDIIEEIARLYGYDNIETTLPKGGSFSARRSPSEICVDRLRERLVGIGFTEIYNFSFMDAALFDKLNLPETDARRKTIELSNPLGADQATMRTTLIPQLLQTAKWNQNRGTKQLRLFELAKTFKPVEGQKLPQEDMTLGLIMMGDRHPPHWSQSIIPLDVFDIKGAIETLLESLHISGKQFDMSEEPFYHPKKAATLFVNGDRIGTFGELHYKVTQQFGLDAPPLVAELNISILKNHLPRTMQYQTLSSFPPSLRDLAFVVPLEVSSQEIIDCIRKFDLVRDVTVFDQYMGHPVPAGKKSLAFAITYQSAEKTLADQEVDEIQSQILAELAATFGIELRQ
ncbi:MAG: phenylalanine--tRNA ligase subunit beta [Gemmatimonadetes bacterium]|nr:MAG: phenylalanine--tRNA ligase subunit beta [Gemmatimonadota bacterium]